MTTRIHKTIPIALVVLLASAMAGASTLTTFSDRSSFDSATSSLNNNTVTFDGLDTYPGLSACIPASGGSSCIVISSYDKDGVIQSIWVPNSSNDPWNLGTGGYGVGIKIGYTYFYPNSVDFGFDFFTLSPSGLSVPVTVTTADGDTHDFLVSTSDSNFWGITSDSTITSILIDDRNVNAFNGFDNVTYDDVPNGPAPVPEPASLFLFGTGMLGFASLLRRFQKR